MKSILLFQLGVKCLHNSHSRASGNPVYVSATTSIPLRMFYLANLMYLSVSFMVIKEINKNFKKEVSYPQV